MQVMLALLYQKIGGYGREAMVGPRNWEKKNVQEMANKV